MFADLRQWRPGFVQICAVHQEHLVAPHYLLLDRDIVICLSKLCHVVFPFIPQGYPGVAITIPRPSGHPTPCLAGHKVFRHAAVHRVVCSLHWAPSGYIVQGVVPFGHIDSRRGKFIMASFTMIAVGIPYYRACLMLHRVVASCVLRPSIPPTIPRRRRRDIRRHFGSRRLLVHSPPSVAERFRFIRAAVPVGTRACPCARARAGLFRIMPKVASAVAADVEVAASAGADLVSEALLLLGASTVAPEAPPSVVRRWSSVVRHPSFVIRRPSSPSSSSFIIARPSVVVVVVVHYPSSVVVIVSSSSSSSMLRHPSCWRHTSLHRSCTAIALVLQHCISWYLTGVELILYRSLLVWYRSFTGAGLVL